MSEVCQSAKVPMTKQEQINNSFTYHRPWGTQPARYEAIRAKAKEFAEFLVANTPYSREQSVAITHLEESVMWANKAIACNEGDEVVGEQKAA